MEADEELWPILTPMLDPPNNPPGWFFLYELRDGELAAAGPYDSQEFCARVIATAEPCDATGCTALTFSDDFSEPERDAAAKASGGKVLCRQCGAEFMEWYTKKHGHPPRPVGEQ